MNIKLQEKLQSISNLNGLSIIPQRGLFKSLTIEAGITHGWEKFSGINDLSIGILDHYGGSGQGEAQE